MQRGLAEGGALYLRMPILYPEFEAALVNLDLIQPYDQAKTEFQLGENPES